ncbi:MAG: glycosyltransferase family 2 protein [Acidobacteria bacterium]|nr:glycosyltransferase family 2 protein [Acidobacteriota bacterium]
MMNIVMPIAGRGSRFREIGIETPKPLIPVAGRPMYAWATDSLPLQLASRLVFVCLKEHLEGWGLREDIDWRYGWANPEIVELPGVTEGQACTVLAARDQLNPDAALLIYNGDTACKTDLEESIPMLPPSVAGLLGVFEGEGDRWSFAKTDAAGRVVETSEKVRISNWACTGLYYFRRTLDFLAIADEMIARQEKVRGEFYVAPVYNDMIAREMEIRINIARRAGVMGTPEDLRAFEADLATHAW